MKRWVIDASVAVKWYVPEVQSLSAARLLDSGVHLLAPDLIVTEVANTLWKKVRRGELSRDDAAEIHAAFFSVPIELRPAAQMFPAALDVALELASSVYDCLYLTLAMEQDCAVVTADEKFHRAVARTRLASHVVPLN
jgi:predicted nucleic acid-binding protein